MGNVLYVGNLSYDMTEVSVRDVFNSAVSVKLITDHETGRSRGFAFIEYANNADAALVLEQLNGKEINGRRIRINEAKPRFGEKRNYTVEHIKSSVPTPIYTIGVDNNISNIYPPHEEISPDDNTSRNIVRKRRRNKIKKKRYDNDENND